MRTCLRGGYPVGIVDAEAPVSTPASKRGFIKNVLDEVEEIDAELDKLLVQEAAR